MAHPWGAARCGIAWPRCPGNQGLEWGAVGRPYPGTPGASSLPAVLQGAVGLCLQLLGAEQLGEGSAEAVVAQRVEDRVDG